MPGIGIAISPHFKNNNFSFARYWATLTNMHLKTRSGNALVDDYSNDATILNPYLYLNATGYYIRTDDGSLDIGASSFAFGGWIKGEDTAKAAPYYLMGKITDSTNGCYGLFINQTTGRLSFFFKPSGTIVYIHSTVDMTDGWHLVYADINQATLKARLFIDNVQIGADVSYTGTFAALDSKYEFTIGAGNDANGTNIVLKSKSSHKDAFVYHRTLTDAERANLLNSVYPTDAEALYPLSEGLSLAQDISGNGNHLTGVVMSPAVNKRYSADGSRLLLDYGFAKYSCGWDDIYVPLTVSGAEITITAPAGYNKTLEGNHAGSLTRHNLADSYIVFVGAEWDRSDTTIWNDQARTGYYDATSATTRRTWHISELNNLRINAWANTGYKGINFVKIADNSYKDRKVLEEIITVDTEITGTEYGNAMVSYFNDYAYVDTYENEYIYWKYTAYNILTQNNLRVLRWENAATDRLHLSIDGGVTYPYVINSPKNGEYPEFAHIFNNGNILIGFNSSIYLSDNNLTSLSAITVEDLGGGDFTATTNSYFTSTKDKAVVIDGTEILVWGNYSIAAQTASVNINVFYTIDGGATIKVCYRAGVTNPPNLIARHVHGVTYREADDSFWIFTGDNANECNVIRGDYDWDLDSWTFTKIAGEADATFKISSLGFYNSGNDMLIGEDAGGAVDTLGLFTSSVANFATRASWTKVFPSKLTSTVAFIDGNDIIASLVGAAGHNSFAVSDTGISGLRGTVLYGLPAGFVISQHITEKNDNGWFLCSVTISGTNQNVQLYNNGAIWIKIK